MVISVSLSFGVLLAALQGVYAQTAPGFSVSSSSQSLNVTFGTNNVSPPGELIPRPDVASPPNITTPVFTSLGRAVLLMVDSDVPRNGTRVELLHWLASNVTLDGNSSSLVIPAGEAEYRQPSPPVGDVPHAYTFILFPQPENFSIPEEFNEVLQSRVFFNTSNFVAAAGLSQPAIAANYIRVQNLTGTATTTFPPPRATNATTGPSSTSPPLAFPGAAPAGFGGATVFWAGLGTALVTGVLAFAL